MTWLHVFWDFGPGGNAEHVAEHGLDLEEVEHVLRNPEKYKVSRRSGAPCSSATLPLANTSRSSMKNWMRTRCTP